MKKIKKVGRYLLLAGLIVVLIAVGAINYIHQQQDGKRQ
jgi:hypothetical protein